MSKNIKNNIDGILLKVTDEVPVAADVP